jgi:hypothetical protein
MGATKDWHIRIQDELFNTVHRATEGEMSHLEALLALREHRAEMEKSLEIIKEYESEKINEIGNEAAQYPDGYHGFMVSVTNGRKTFSFKGIPEWEEAEQTKKTVEDKYKTMFEAKTKGALHANISEEGEELPLPEVNYGKSFLTVKPTKTR